MWYLNRENLHGKQILELGSGTGLPGILAAACGASVLLTDDEEAEPVIKNARLSLEACNPVTWQHTRLESDLSHFENVSISSSSVLPLSWGTTSAQILLEYQNRPFPDLIIAADCFYDNKEDFDAVFATLDYFFDKNPNCIFITSYQVRSINTDIDRNAKKWGFKTSRISLDGDFSFPQNKYDFIQEVQLIRISPK